MDTAHWPQHQDIGSLRSMEELVVTSSASNNTTTTTIRPQQQQPQQQQMMERRVRPEKEQALNCPRCNSTNTKFCYYNNYSLTQPRYFCKTCRRYWTAGGSLRNVPVGGGSRKNKRSSTSSSTSSAPAAEATSISSAAKKLLSEQNPSKFQQEGQDLNLAFPALHHEFRVGVGIGESSSTNPTAAVVTGSGAMSAMELLRSPFMHQMPMSLPMPEYPSGFGIQDLRANTTLSFPLHGHGGGGGGGYGGLQETGGNASGSRLLFPFEESSTNRGHVSSSSAVTEQKGQQDPPGFWNGMIGGGGGSW